MYKKLVSQSPIQYERRIFTVVTPTRNRSRSSIESRNIRPSNAKERPVGTLIAVLQDIISGNINFRPIIGRSYQFKLNSDTRCLAVDYERSHTERKNPYQLLDDNDLRLARLKEHRKNYRHCIRLREGESTPGEHIWNNVLERTALFVRFKNAKRAILLMGFKDFVGCIDSEQFFAFRNPEFFGHFEDCGQYIELDRTDGHHYIDSILIGSQIGERVFLHFIEPILSNP